MDRQIEESMEAYKRIEKIDVHRRLTIAEKMCTQGHMA